jgi:hypothetical protein
MTSSQNDGRTPFERVRHEFPRVSATVPERRVPETMRGTRAPIAESARPSAAREPHSLSGGCVIKARYVAMTVSGREPAAAARFSARVRPHGKNLVGFSVSVPTTVGRRTRHEGRNPSPAVPLT